MLPSTVEFQTHYHPTMRIEAQLRNPSYVPGPANSLATSDLRSLVLLQEKRMEGRDSLNKLAPSIVSRSQTVSRPACRESLATRVKFPFRLLPVVYKRVTASC